MGCDQHLCKICFADYHIQKMSNEDQTAMLEMKRGVLDRYSWPMRSVYIDFLIIFCLSLHSCYCSWQTEQASIVVGMCLSWNGKKWKLVKSLNFFRTLRKKFEFFPNTSEKPRIPKFWKFGKSLEHIQKTFGKPLGNLQKTFGKPSEKVWKRFGKGSE